MHMVSKKDMVFVTVLFLVVIIFSLVTGGEAVEVSFGEETMSINAINFEFNIAYADVASVELAAMPDLGTMAKGTDTVSLKHGNWNNSLWGDYHLCVDPTLPNCVVVELKDGRHVVFNYKSEESTQDVCGIFQDRVNG